MAHTPEEPAGRDLTAHDTGTTITIEADIAPHPAQALLAEWAEDDDDGLD